MKCPKFIATLPEKATLTHYQIVRSFISHNEKLMISKPTSSGSVTTQMSIPLQSLGGTGGHVPQDAYQTATHSAHLLRKRKQSKRGMYSRRSTNRGVIVVWRREMNPLRCYRCGRLLPKGFDHVASHHPKCPMLITIEEAN